MTMISVQQSCNHAVSAGAISDEDLVVLKREVLADGIMSRDEADLPTIARSSLTRPDEILPCPVPARKPRLRYRRSVVPFFKFEDDIAAGRQATAADY